MAAAQQRLQFRLRFVFDFVRIRRHQLQSEARWRPTLPSLEDQVRERVRREEELALEAASVPPEDPSEEAELERAFLEMEIDVQISRAKRDACDWPPVTEPLPRIPLRWQSESPVE